MKRKINIKKIILVVVVIIVIVSGINYLNYINSTYYKLKKIGYSKAEISNIAETLSKEEVKIILDKKEYISKLNGLILEEYFMFKNLDRYLNYNNQKNYLLKEIVAIVNTNNDYEFYQNIKETDINQDELMLVNKFHHLKSDYNPIDIVKMSSQYAYDNNYILDSTYIKFIELTKAAKEAGFIIVANSSFRTYQTQEALYNNRVNQVGVEEADLYAARPGHSEHQTGYAIDINEYGMGNDDFENTDSYKWLLNNAHKYGFILRYPKDKEHITGYSFEAWHYRYVGVSVATKIKNLGITFDEYYAYFIEV